MPSCKLTLSTVVCNLAAISFVICIDVENGLEIHSLRDKLQNCLMNHNECVVENYTDNCVRISSSPSESYFLFQTNLVSSSNTYNNEHFEYYINNQNSKNYQDIDPLLKISVTIVRHNRVCTFYTSISSYGKYLMSQTENKVTVGNDRPLKFSLFLSINKINKVIENFVKIQGEACFPCIFSHLYLPHTNTSLSMNKEVYIDLVNTKKHPRLHFDKILKHSGEQALPSLDVHYCVLKSKACVYEAINEQSEISREGVIFKFSSNKFKETDMIRITGSPKNTKTAGITFRSIGPRGSRVRQYIEISDNNKIDLYGNIVKPLIWSNSTPSFLLWGTCQNGTQNNDKAKVYVEKDDSFFLLANMDIILCNLTTIKLTGVELGVSVEVAEYYDHSVTLISTLVIFSIMLLFIVFAIVYYFKIRPWKEKKKNDESEGKYDDGATYIYDDAFQFQRSRESNNEKSNDVYFTDQCKKSSVIVECPVDETSRKVKSRVHLVRCMYIADYIIR